MIHTRGLVQNCGNTTGIANAVELLQFCTKPLIWWMMLYAIHSKAIVTNSRAKLIWLLETYLM